MSREVIWCENLQQAAIQTVEIIADIAFEAVQRQGFFSLALSGGNTPAALYKQLCLAENRSKIPWAQTEIFWSDERCVPPGHQDSNYGLAWRELLQPLEIDERKIHRLPGEVTPEDGALSGEKALQEILGDTGRLDCVLLGMGADGHTASLFPGTSALEETSRLVVANYVSQLKSWRLTMTLPCINKARNVIFLMTCNGKEEAIHRVLEENDISLPATRVCPLEGNTIWVIAR